MLNTRANLLSSGSNFANFKQNYSFAENPEDLPNCSVLWSIAADLLGARHQKLALDRRFGQIQPRFPWLKPYRIET